MNSLRKLSQKLQIHLLVATVLFVTLYPKFPLFNLQGVTVAVRLEDFLIAFTVLVFLFANIKSYKDFLRPVFLAILVFWFIGLVSVFSGAFLTQTLDLQTGILHWGRRIQYMSMFFVATKAVKSSSDLNYIIKAIFIVIAYAFLYGVGQKYFDLPVITTQNPEYSKGIALFYLPGGHLVSTFAGHYDLASVMLVFTPMLYILLFSKPSELKRIFGLRPGFVRILILVVSAMSLWLIVQAASRISIASYLLVSTSALILIRKYKYIPIAIIVTLIFISLSSNLINRYMNIFNVYGEKITAVQDSWFGVYAQETGVQEPPPIEDRSTSIRLNVEWPRALRAFQKNPFLGTGYSSITLATDNDYLRSLGETGLLGTTALFMVFFFVVHAILRQAVSGTNTDKIFAYSALSVLPGIFVNMIFIDILEASKFAILFWMFLGFACFQSVKSKNYVEK